MAALGAAAGGAFEVYRHLTAGAAAGEQQQQQQQQQEEEEQQQQQQQVAMLAVLVEGSKHPDADINAHAVHAAHYCCLSMQQRQLISDALQQQHRS